MTDQAAAEGAGVEGGDDDARGDFATEGDDGEDQLGHHAVDQPANVLGSGVRRCFLSAEPRGGGVAVIAGLEQVADDLVAGFTGHWVRVLQEASGQDDKEDFEDGVVLDDAVLAE